MNDGGDEKFLYSSEQVLDGEFLRDGNLWNSEIQFGIEDGGGCWMAFSHSGEGSYLMNEVDGYGRYSCEWI